MKIAIMQPYFFPYLGYFDLINYVDLFVVYDIVQYTRGWINRNRIFKQNKIGWEYISVPLEKASFQNSNKTAICDIKISTSQPWKEHILGKLSHYKNNARYAYETIEFLENALSVDISSISYMNVHTLYQSAKLLSIDMKYIFSSKLNIKLDKFDSPEKRIIDLCKFLKASEYVNLSGGVGLYDFDSFKREGIKLTFRNLPTFMYPTSPYTFEDHLSIIDVLMWNKPEEIKYFLDCYKR